ncbi:MAG: STAS domain-containing protein [Pseudomonadota bacterium]
MSSESMQLPQRTTIDTAQQALSAATDLGEGATMVFDASEVEAMDGATTLVLANIAQTLAGRGTPAAVEKPSAAFVDAFSDLGLFDDLMKMEFRK